MTTGNIIVANMLSICEDYLDVYKYPRGWHFTFRFELITFLPSREGFLRTSSKKVINYLTSGRQ